MPLVFYPTSSKATQGTLEERIQCLKSGAHEFKEKTIHILPEPMQKQVHYYAPREQKIAYNWDAISRALREAHALPENSTSEKERKANFLLELAEIYAILRDAKMSKLEAVRVALNNEAVQLKANIQVA